MLVCQHGHSSSWWYVVVAGCDACEVGIPIPGSRPIFSIPNPGIGNALIQGFRDYEN